MHLGVERLLGTLRGLSRSLSLSELELERFSHDLTVVQTRLETRDYLIHSYSANAHNLADRVQDIFAEVEYYSQIGRDWQGVLQSVQLDSIKEVLDMCPGFTPKVELGLYYSGYSGKVVLHNKDVTAVQQLAKFLELFSPKFDLQMEYSDIFESSVGRYSLITANHVIDDLILDFYVTAINGDVGQYYKQEQLILEAWRSISRSPSTYTEPVLDQLVDYLVRHAADDCTIILSQYRSYVERILGMNEVAQICSDVVSVLVDRMGEAGFVRSVPRSASSGDSGRGCVIAPREFTVLVRGQH